VKFDKIHKNSIDSIMRPAEFDWVIRRKIQDSARVRVRVRVRVKLKKTRKVLIAA